MKLWIQRVLSASVDVGDERLSEIGRGFLILLGVGRGDTPETADRLAKRAVALRIFEDAEGMAGRWVFPNIKQIETITKAFCSTPYREG